MDDHERVDENRRHWDEAACLHATNYFDGDGALDGQLKAFEVVELGDIAGQRICHLQCHIGGNTLALARLGATVVGVDFSPAALDIARQRASAARLDDRVLFLCADIEHATDVLDEHFDGIYVSWGSICWLPDLMRWATAIRSLLRAGGWLYLAETHPYAMSVRWPHYHYGDATPILTKGQGDYVSTDATFEHDRTWEWNHGLGEIITAILDAGLALEWLHEHSVIVWNLGNEGELVERADGLWEAPGSTLPLAFSLRAIAT